MLDVTIPPKKAHSDNVVLVMIFGNLRLIVENYVKVAPFRGVHFAN
jgi:hypothetical protein